METVEPKKVCRVCRLPAEGSCDSDYCNNAYCSNCAVRAGGFIDGRFYCYNCNRSFLEDIIECSFCSKSYPKRCLYICSSDNCSKKICLNCCNAHGDLIGKSYYCDNCVAKIKTGSGGTKKCSICTSSFKEYEIVFKSEDGILCANCAKMTAGKPDDFAINEAERLAKLERKKEIEESEPPKDYGKCVECGIQFYKKFSMQMFCTKCSHSKYAPKTPSYNDSIANYANSNYLIQLSELKENRDVIQEDLKSEMDRVRKSLAAIPEDEQIAVITALLTGEKPPVVEPPRVYHLEDKAPGKPPKCCICKAQLIPVETRESDTYCDNILCAKRICSICTTKGIKSCNHCKEMNYLGYEEPVLSRCFDCGGKDATTLCKQINCVNMICSQCDRIGSPPKGFCAHCKPKLSVRIAGDREVNAKDPLVEKFEEMQRDIKQLKADRRAIEKVLEGVIEELRALKDCLRNIA